MDARPASHSQPATSRFLPTEAGQELWQLAQGVVALRVGVGDDASKQANGTAGARPPSVTSRFRLSPRAPDEPRAAASASSAPVWLGGICSLCACSHPFVPGIHSSIRLFASKGGRAVAGAKQTSERSRSETRQQHAASQSEATTMSGGGAVAVAPCDAMRPKNRFADTRVPTPPRGG
jgi:hypothetical protein